MYTCLACGNSSYRTKFTRPELVYHRLPSNANLRKRWLDVLRIGQCCSEWQFVCGDHFLEENYRPGKRVLFRNTIPQPYDQKCDQNGFSNNYSIQTNDVETGNNAVLPMEQNIIIKEEDTVVNNNIKAQRRSGRKLKSTKVNDDMNYYEYLPRPKIEKCQIPAVIETDVKPVLTATKDRTLKYGPCCSVKKCFNRSSKELSFFGYPKDLTLRKKWIARSGLVVSPTALKIINRYKVCGAHFEDDCFKNTKLKNRLRPGAIPTLFVEDDIIESRNIPLTNSPVNSGFVHINKSSCSSSNYVENVESKHTPSLAYNDSTNQVLKSSVPSALLIPIDAWRSASNARNNLPDIIESRNIPSTNSLVNSGFVHINKSSCSSSNYVENVESKHTSLVYNELTNQVLKSSVPAALPIPIEAWQSASNSINNLPVLTDIIEVRNVPSSSEFVHVYKPSSSSSDYVVNVESKDTPLLAYNTSIKDFEPYCSIPGCRSYITNTDDGPYLFAPTIECVNKWSSALGLQLNVNCCICERHFSPQDLICKEFMVDGLKKVVKLLIHSALPIPINAVGLTSNAQNNLQDNTDKCSKSNITITIDDFSNIDSTLKQKLKKISAKNSLSITLEPIQKSKVKEPSVDLFSKTSAAIRTPVISKCISLARIPDTHNSSSNKNNPTSNTFSLINNMEVFERH